MPPRHLPIGEDALHHRLRIVETAVDGDVVDIGRQHRGHLAALHVADAARWVEHEDLDIVAPRHRIDRGAARVAAGRADDGEAAVVAREKLLEQQAEQLQRHILESERRAVEEFKEPLAFVELFERRHCAMGKTAIGLFAQFAQAIGRQAFPDEGPHDPRRQFGIGQAAHLRDICGGEPGPLFRHIETTIAGETRQRDLGEIERGGGAACRDIAHGGWRLDAPGRTGKAGALYAREVRLRALRAAVSAQANRYPAQ